MKYTKGEATQIAEDRIFRYDPDYDDIPPGMEYIDTLDEISVFSDKVKTRLAELGHGDIGDDVKHLMAALVGYCAEAGVDISRQTLKNWLTKAPPDGNSRSRENVYKLCFALKMDANQTGEFFLKAYLERPFNYKNIREAVYFFCLQTGRNYQAAERLIRRIESESSAENPDAVVITEQIGEDIRSMESEEGFVRYMVENKPGFAAQNLTATKEIEKLIEKAKPLATSESERFGHAVSSREKTVVNSVDDLLKVIYGYSLREPRGQKKASRAGIKSSRLPELIKRNFPESQEMSMIHNGTASFSTLRKALILLNFYHFFVSARLQKEPSNDLFDQFTIEMDSILEKCGYVQLYWRNPFDWMIGYCAFSQEPLGTFRDLIEEYYLKPAEQTVFS